jgi:hypothetical protein
MPTTTIRSSLASLACALLIGACQAAATASPPSSPPSSPSAVTSGADVDLLRTLETRRTADLVAGDIDAGAAVLADDFTLVDPTGELETRADYLASLQSGELDYLAWTAESPLDVRVVGDAAIMRYRSAIDVTIAGSRIPGRFWQTEYFERRGGQWMLVWGHTSPIQ